MYIKTKNPHVTEGYKKMILGFVIVTILLVLIILYFSASKVVLKVTPKVTSIETDFIADVYTDGGGSGESVLQATLFQTEEAGSVEGESTGTKMLAGDSIGKVTIYNKRPLPQALIVKTRLLTSDGILLRLSAGVNIPANGSVEADVYADDPSKFTELAPSKFTIPGLSDVLQQVVYAESKSTIASTGTSVKVVKAVDIARAKEKLNETLYNKAIDKFMATLPNKNFTTMVVSKKVVDETVSDSVDSEKSVFTVSEKLQLTLIGIDQQKIVTLAGERLKSIIPAGQDLLSLNLGNFSYKVQNYDEAKKVANLKVHVSGEVVIKADSPILDKEKLVGLTPKGVELYLANYEEIQSVSTELSPFWVRTIPKMKDHIIISIEPPADKSAAEPAQ